MMTAKTTTTARKPASCPWDDAKQFAVGAGFEIDLRTDTLDAAITMLRRRLGFLCLGRDEIETEVAMAKEAAGV